MSEDVVTQPPANLVAGVVKAIRPRQWVKNVLVLAAPLAALGGGVRYDYVEVLSKVSMAFVVFSLAASAVYLVNDVRDVEADREHPTKRFRPIAAGVCPSGWRTPWRWYWE
ncbi:phosphoribose diphosphate:decaprenyl-phosphate phosphoribosyltransferase [Mycobacterium tuberculosis]|nr:phosphoribose diphosphate:decaprenyl-phosphate phosphoribosyltransferase [Mycobacterium tuberculosis]